MTPVSVEHDPPISPGTLVADRYLVLDRIGGGGEARIFMAKERSTGAMRALRLARSDVSYRTERTLRNAAFLRRLNHPNVIRVFDAGLLPNGIPYVVTEWVDGLSLRQYLKERQLLIWEICTIGASIANALACVHAAGGVHRDVKPDNIMIRTSDTNVTPEMIVLLDFGLLQEIRPSVQNIDRRTICGTVRYMAPEQLTGRRSSPKTDLYALGATLYELTFGEMLAGHDPWDRVEIPSADFPLVFAGQLVRRRLTEEVVLPEQAHVPDELRELLKSLLRRDPAERVHSAETVEHVLKRIRESKLG